MVFGYLGFPVMFQIGNWTSIRQNTSSLTRFEKLNVVALIAMHTTIQLRLVKVCAVNIEHLLVFVNLVAEIL